MCEIKQASAKKLDRLMMSMDRLADAIERLTASACGSVADQSLNRVNSAENDTPGASLA